MLINFYKLAPGSYMSKVLKRPWLKKFLNTMLQAAPVHISSLV